MKIKINCELDGTEIIQYFHNKLKENNIESTDENIKILVYSEKAQKDVEVKATNIKIVFNKE